MGRLDTSRTGAVACAGIVIIGIVLRLTWLDADPDYSHWHGYLTDEGRWIENVRSLLLFDELLLPTTNLHLWVAPIFQAVSYVIFWFLDISRWTARIFPALCGCGLLVVLWGGLRDRVDAPALAIALALVAFQEDLVMLSRICIPEMPAMLAELCAFLVLVKAGDSRRGLLVAGLIMAAGLGLKATAAPTWFSLGVFAWCCGTPGIGNRARRVLAFASPAMILGILACASAIAVDVSHGGLGLAWLQVVIRDVPIISSFIGVHGLYSILAFPFESPLAPTLNFWMLGAWMGALMALVAPEQASSPIRRLGLGAVIWGAGLGTTILTLSYFPDRYKVHVFIPLIILIAVAVHVFLRFGLARFVERTISLPPGLRRVLVLSLLALPCAVLVAPAPFLLLDQLGFDIDHLRWQILLIGVAWLILVIVLHRGGRSGVALIVPVSVAGAITRLAGSQWMGWRFWIGSDDAGILTQSGIVVGATIALAWLAIRQPRWFAISPAVVTVAIYGSFAILPYGHSLIWPRYDLREVSRDLGSLLSADDEIVSCRVEGFFVDNDLRYQSHYRLAGRKDSPSVIVLFRGGSDLCYRELAGELSEGYQVLRSYKLSAPPRGRSYPTELLVYRLNSGPGNSTDRDR